MHKQVHMLRFLMVLFLVTNVFGQQRSIEEWEKETFLKQPPEKVMDVAGIKPGMIIGEVGAGRGRFTVHLAERVGDKGKILANDIDADALAYLKDRCQKEGITNVEIILGEVDDPHFPEGSLDMVFMVWTYHYFDRPIAMLNKLHPSLKPGGTMVLVEPDPIDGPGGTDHGISPERMRRDAAEAGFEVVRIEDFLEWDLIFVLKIRESFPDLRGPYLGQNPPGRTPELFAPRIISTCNQHGSVYFTPDGREVYFSRMLPQPSLIMYMGEENGLWTSPSIVCEGLTPGLAADGTTVLFSTWELWRMNKTPTGWTEPENFGPLINFQKRQDTPYVSASGTLYFCSMFGEQDGIYRAELKNGIYLQPERLEYGISSEYSDFSPCVAPDESYLIFASTRPGYGITDLYISFRNRDGTWTTPNNMGPNINTGAKEAFPFVSFDGKYIFFMSNRISELNSRRIPDGAGNVFWVDAGIIEDFRSEK